MRGLYRKRATHYDRVTTLYRWLGFRDRRYRARAVELLQANAGDTVLDLACGTGLNFGVLRQAVGGTGRVVGVDLTDAMLERADRRVHRAGWTNVDLVEADLAHWSFPPADGILCTLALHLVPSYDAVIERAAAALHPGGRLVILDLKRPERWPDWAVALGVRLNRGYGVSLELASRTPAVSLRAHLQERHYEELFGGALYLIAGEKAAPSVPPA